MFSCNVSSPMGIRVVTSLPRVNAFPFSINNTLSNKTLTKFYLFSYKILLGSNTYVEKD